MDQQALQVKAEQWVKWDKNPLTREAVEKALQAASQGTGTWETLKVCVGFGVSRLMMATLPAPYHDS